MTITFDPSPDFHVADGRDVITLAVADLAGALTNYADISAIGQRLTGSPEEAGGVQLVLTRRAWLLDGTALPVGVKPDRGDQIIEADATTWIIESVWVEPLSKQWRCDTLKKLG